MFNSPKANAMFNLSPLLQRLGQWLSIAALLGFGLVFAQTEPSLSQINAAAQSGQLDQAQLMIQQVLIAHPNSGKAHFVQAELFAKQGKSSHAAEALATAEKLAPGLTFAKPEAVQSLRTQIAATPKPTATRPSAARAVEQVPATASATSSWGLPLLLTAGVMVFGFFFFRRKAAQTFNAPMPGSSPGVSPGSSPGASPYGNPAQTANGLSGPQAFGANPAAPGQSPQPGYGQPAYGQPMAGQPAAPGMGSRIMGGVATGLAVGAGVMAAQAIAKSIGGDHDSAHKASDNAGGNYQPVASNYDMGGQNMGLNDTSSWDDGGGSMADSGGGGDWDS